MAIFPGVNMCAYRWGVVFWVGLYIIVSRYVCVYGCVFVYVIFGLKVCKFIYLFRSLCGTLYLVSL